MYSGDYRLISLLNLRNQIFITSTNSCSTVPSGIELHIVKMADFCFIKEWSSKNDHHTKPAMGVFSISVYMKSLSTWKCTINESHLFNQKWWFSVFTSLSYRIIFETKELGYSEFWPCRCSRSRSGGSSV